MTPVTPTRRDDTSNYLAIGGDVSFLLEQLHSWVLDITTVDGEDLTIVCQEATRWVEDEGTCVIGFIYGSGNPDDPEDDADYYRRTGHRPVGAMPVQIPWRNIDTVTVN